MCDKSTAFPVFPRRSTTRMDVLLGHDHVVDRSSSSSSPSSSNSSSPSGRRRTTMRRDGEEGTRADEGEERGAAGNQHLVVLQAPPRLTATGFPRHLFSERPTGIYHDDCHGFSGNNNNMSNDRHDDDNTAFHHHCMLLATIDTALEILGMYEDDVDNDFGDRVVDRVVLPQ